MMAVAGTVFLKDVGRPCPVCDSRLGEVLHTQRFVLPDGYLLPPTYDVVCCAHCGFAYADTAASQLDYDAMYSLCSPYTDSETSTGGGETAWDAERLEDTAAAISRFLPDKHARIVDIGCARGGLLRALSRLGYDNLCGIDPSPACVAQTAQVPGVDACCGTLLQIPTEAGPFDCVILTHVLEHVRDLKPALAYLRRFLKPDACLYVETPDATRFADFPFGPFQDFNIEHINYFSPVSLSNLLRQCGFTPTASGTKEMLRAPGMPYPILFAFANSCANAFASILELQKEKVLTVCVANYIAISRRVMEEIEAHLQRVLAQTPEVLVWGTGQCTMELLAWNSLGNTKIVAFVDSNPIKQGRFLCGIPVLAPSQVKPGTHPIIVASILHQDAIAESIRCLGLPNPIVALGSGNHRGRRESREAL